MSVKAGSTQSVPTNNFQKIWIVPDSVKIYEDNDRAFIASCHLKVKTEEQNPAFITYILPLIEKEVNEGKNFSSLRQTINSLVLAIWFKGKLKDAFLTKAYADKSLTQGIASDDPQFKEKIYQNYLKAFEAGAYNYIKKEKIGMSRITSRRYFSGGVDITRFAESTVPWSDEVMRQAILDGNLIQVNVDIVPLSDYTRQGNHQGVIRVDLKHDEATRRYADGHESLHALIDELRLAGEDLSWLDEKTEEKLAIIFGYARRDGHALVSVDLIKDVRLLQDRLNDLLTKHGKPTVDNLLEYLQNNDKYDHRNPQTLKRILREIGINVDVRAATASELSQTHKSETGPTHTTTQTIEKQPSTVYLLGLRANGKPYWVHKYYPRVNDFIDNQPIIVSRKGLREFFTEFDKATLIMNEVLGEFMSSGDIRCEIDGIVFFKVVVGTQICPAFLNTEENLIQVAKRFKLKRRDAKLLELAKQLSIYNEKKHVAISYDGLETLFNNPEQAAKVINDALGDFMASSDTSRVINGITFSKALRSSIPVPVFFRTPENIIMVAKMFKLKLVERDYLKFIRELPEFNGDKYIAISGPGLDGIYRNPQSAAEKLNEDARWFIFSFKKREVINGIVYVKMRAKNNRPILAVAKTPENVISIAERNDFTLSQAWINATKKARKSTPAEKEYISLDAGGERIFYDHEKAITKIKNGLADFIASPDTSHIYKGIEFTKIHGANGIVVRFNRADRLKVAEAFGLILMEDLEVVNKTMIAVSPNGCNSIFLPSHSIAVYRLIKKALADFLKSPELTCWRFGILWEKALERGQLVIICQNNAENIGIIEKHFDTIYYSSDGAYLDGMQSIPIEAKYRNYVLVGTRNFRRIFFDGENLANRMTQELAVFLSSDKLTTIYKNIEFVKLDPWENVDTSIHQQIGFNPHDARKVAKLFGTYLLEDLVPYRRRKHTVINQDNIGKVFYRQKSPGEYSSAQELYAIFKDKMMDFIVSNAVTSRRFGVHWFKMLCEESILPGFESTPENIAKVAYACDMRPTDPVAAVIYDKMVAEGSQPTIYRTAMPLRAESSVPAVKNNTIGLSGSKWSLPKYNATEYITTSRVSLFETFYYDKNNRPYPFQRIGKVLKKFIKSNLIKYPYMGITFYKLISEKGKVLIAFRRSDIPRVAEVFEIRARQVLEKYTNECGYIPASGTILKDIYQYSNELADRINRELKGFMASNSKTTVCHGITFIKMLVDKHEYPAFADTEENKDLVAKEFAARRINGLRHTGEYAQYILANQNGCDGYLYNARNTVKRIREVFAKFLASREIKTVYGGVEFIKFDDVDGPFVGFHPDDGPEVAKLFSTYLINDIRVDEGEDIVIVDSTHPLYPVVKQQMGEFIKSYDLVCEEFGVPWFKVLNGRAVSIGFMRTAENIARVNKECARMRNTVIAQKKDVGGIDVTTNAVNIQTEGKFNSGSIKTSIIAKWKNLKGVTFDIISIRKISSQDLFAAP